MTTDTTLLIGNFWVLPIYVMVLALIVYVIVHFIRKAW